MNSLNLLSSRVIGQAPPHRPRSKSQGEILKKEQSDELLRGRSYSDEKVAALKNEGSRQDLLSAEPEDIDTGQETPLKAEEDDEKKPLLDIKEKLQPVVSPSSWRRLVKRLADALTAILSAIGAPAVYIAQYFKDEHGRYSILPKRRRKGNKSRSTGNTVGLSAAGSNESWTSEKPGHKMLQGTKLRHEYSSDSMTSATDSDSDRKRSKREKKTSNEPRRSSIRIKEQNDPALKKRKQKRSSPLGDSTPLTVDNIKSPTSPIPSLKVTRYPHAPQPPRPLTPRRQPSYSNLIPRSPIRGAPASQQQKTLVLDLDETLIHSLAKGGRMSSGHMVEVKLNAPVSISSPSHGQATQVIGPQHPILYYVHKRPHCDEFLKKVCKWYKLVIFTASVQEYADPVIDWLEQERKYFVGRYYRQHCTFRNGAYIKDLSSIEPDLSKVIILDNSPVSYIFHEGMSDSPLQ